MESIKRKLKKKDAQETLHKHKMEDSIFGHLGHYCLQTNTV